MANPARAKGTAWESAVVAYMHSEGITAARRNAQHGAADIGDIGGVPHFALECKAHKAISLSMWVAQAKVEARNAGADYGAVIAKKPGASTADGYVIMDLATFVELLKSLAALEHESASRDVWDMARTFSDEASALTVVVDDLPFLIRKAMTPGPIA